MRHDSDEGYDDVQVMNIVCSFRMYVINNTEVNKEAEGNAIFSDVISAGYHKVWLSGKAQP